MRRACGGCKAVPSGNVCSSSYYADPKLYNNVTVFVPDGSSSEYVKRDYRKLTKKQFTAKMGSYACRQVVPVDEKPSQLLALADCADTAVDIEDVQLQDGMQLVMVVGAEGASKKIEKSVRGSTCPYRHSTGVFITSFTSWNACSRSAHPIHEASGLDLQ